VIESAGGVIWRVGASDRHEVLIVHRRHQQDWSLPKGRRRRHESALACALREVREETGLRCRVERELPEVRYVDRHGRSRRVRYWAMHAVRGEFRANDEVDEVRWSTFDSVSEVLSQEHEVLLVTGLPLTCVHIA
jgi:8-oxo-dGTP pyrophosphatase MutT (NUDIX family)